MTYKKRKFGWYKRGKYDVFNGNIFTKWEYQGKLHREDDPAHDWYNGNKGWYLEGKAYTEQTWIYEMRRRKLKVLENCC